MTEDEKRRNKNAQAREAWARRTPEQRAAKLAAQRRRRADPVKLAKERASQNDKRRAWSEERKEHERRLMRERRKTWPEERLQKARADVRRINYLARYGITLEQRDAMFAAQGGCCACCRSDKPGSRYGWSTDHDHEYRRGPRDLVSRL